MIRIRGADLAAREDERSPTRRLDTDDGHALANHGVGHMGKGFIGSLALLLTGAGIAFGQPGGPVGMPPGAVGGFPPGAGGPPPGGPGGFPPEGFMTNDGRPLLPPPGLEGSLHPAYIQPGPYQGGFGMGEGGGFGTGEGLLGGSSESPVFWMRGDYTLWTPKSFNSHTALASTSAPAALGILGSPTTVPLYGHKNTDFGFGSGFRILAGFAFDESSAFELGGFWMEQLGKQFRVSSSSTGSPLLAVPFYDNEAAANGSYYVSFPAGPAGSIAVDSSTQIWGADGHVVFHLARAFEGSTGFDLLVGGRFLELREGLTLLTDSRNITFPTGVFGSSYGPLGIGTFGGAGAGAVGVVPFNVQTTDSIETTNRFYGGSVGFRTDSTLGRFTFTGTGKFGAGIMRQTVAVNASSTLNEGNGSSASYPGGVLFGGAELGRQSKNRFAMIPEGGIDIGFQLTPRVRIHAGYTFMWISSVIRPSSVLTARTNPSVSPVSPTYTGVSGGPGYVPRDLTRDTDYWLQGVNFGIAFQF